MSETKFTPGPWEWRDAAGAGLQISATLPVGFKFDGTARGADGKTSFMIWTVRAAYTVQIADERWVQFSTGSWEDMQRANARLIAAAPDMLALLQELIDIEGPQPGNSAWAQKVHAAITKATGE